MFNSFIVFVSSIFGFNTVMPEKQVPTVSVPEDEIVIINYIPENSND